METIKKTSLYCQDGKSNKEYHIQLVKSGDGFCVNYQHGKIGGTLKTGTKTPTPLEEQSAHKVYNSLLKEKLTGGYEEKAVKDEFAPIQIELTTRIQNSNIRIMPQLLNVVENAHDCINDEAYHAQEKMDGERRILISGECIYGLNKKGTQVQLPTAISKSINIPCILDGEIIGEKYYAFDILELNGESLKSQTFEYRNTVLNIQGKHFGPGIEIVRTAYTNEQKQKLFTELKMNNKEGIVFKKKESQYIAGRPGSGGDHLKFPFYKRATFVVANHTGGKRSVGLELVSGTERVFMGKVTIPANKGIPEVGDLVEVRYLYAYEKGAIFQPVYEGKRTDCDLSDADIKQIVYKSDKFNGIDLKFMYVVK